MTTTAADIDRWHKGRGWSGAGYHQIIESSGEAILGRPLKRIPAANRGFNTHAIAICLVGDNTTLENRWVAPQVEKLKVLLSVHCTRWPEAIVLGHCDLPGAATLCPGLDVRQLLGLSPLVDGGNE